VLRYPEGQMPADLPDLGPFVRAGKIAIWMAYTNIPDWPERLVEVLQKLKPEVAGSPA
jgi:hypothetical protein